MYYISDIKNELNRICTVDGVKKVTIGIIWEYLVSQGLTHEEGVNGVFVKKPTAKGTEYGILLEDKVTPSGVPYQLIKYPPSVQKMIVDYLAGPGREEDGKLKEEYLSGIKIAEIARIHGSTPDDIRSRLKRHGLIE